MARLVDGGLEVGSTGSNNNDDNGCVELEADVGPPAAVVAVFPLPAKDIWPISNIHRRNDSLKHIAPLLLHVLVSTIPLDNVSIVMTGFGEPSDVVTPSVTELDICSLTDVV